MGAFKAIWIEVWVLGGEDLTNGVRWEGGTSAISSVSDLDWLIRSGEIGRKGQRGTGIRREGFVDRGGGRNGERVNMYLWR